LVGDTPKDEQVNLSHEVRKIFMCFVIRKLLGVVAAAIQGSVDCEDYFSHWIVLTPLLVQPEFNDRAILSPTGLLFRLTTVARQSRT
jgi:predicted benzoate:H+ symporter BenE